MRWLKTLSAIYVVMASGYTAALVLDRHPVLTRALVVSTRAALHEGGDAALALDDHLLEPGWFLIARQAGRAVADIRDSLRPRRRLAVNNTLKKPVRVARLALKPEAPPVPMAVPAPVQEPPSAAVPAPHLRPQIEPRAAAVEPPAPRRSAPPLPPEAIPPAPAAAVAPASPAELALVSARLRDSLTRELLTNFDLFLYVSKADRGPVAQHMYVFAKTAAGRLDLRYDWPVSTGREVVESNPAGRRLNTNTPAGYYELDPHRMYVHYTSHEWGEPMPHAMFFNWVHDGNLTGLAIHSAYGDKELAELGSRASAGCVRLSPAHARTLFELVRSDYAGPEARFAYDRRTDTMSNSGELARRPDGSLRFEKGYRVLVVIEDFGGKPVVAIM